MGYYTQYDLSVVCDPNHEMGVDLPYSAEDMLRWCEANGFDDGSCLHAVVTSYQDGYASEPMKWYVFDDEMKKFSLAFPDVLFCLAGNGEEDDDIWKCYFMNGKMQRCVAKVTIEYPEFDPSLLE